MNSAMILSCPRPEAPSSRLQQPEVEGPTEKVAEACILSQAVRRVPAVVVRVPILKCRYAYQIEHLCFAVVETTNLMKRWRGFVRCC